jgi:CubicO group peptidase (beta-lactamase class C family)
LIRYLFGIVLAGALASSSTAQSVRVDSVRIPPRTLDELRSQIGEVLQQSNTPGMGLALVARDSVIWVAGLGQADVAAGRAATGRTLFRIGSTSKALTALVALMLREEGKLTLDDPIRRHIPEIWFENRWEATTPVRIAHALEHTTGFDEWSFIDSRNNDPTPLTLRQGLDLNPETRVSRWRPGTRVAYSNTGPALVAYIAETIESKPFEQIVQERLFDPIGMHTATFLLPDTPRVVTATLYHGNGQTPYSYQHLVMRPAGAVNASAEDMAAYVRFLLNRGVVNGQQLLPVTAIERLERTENSLTAGSGLRVGYGLAMARYVERGFVWTGHDGGVNGGLTIMAYLPEHGVGFAFMLNSDHVETARKIDRLVRDFLTRDLPPPTPPMRAAMPEVVRARYSGWYRRDNPRAQIRHFLERLTSLTRVTATDSAIVLTPVLGKPERYLQVGGLTFRRANEPVATLALLDDSANDRPVAIERMGYLLPRSLVHVSAVIATAELGLAGVWLVAAALSLVAMAVGFGRRILGLLRRRPLQRSHASILWRLSGAATVTVVLSGATVAGAFTPFAVLFPAAYLISAHVLLISAICLGIVAGAHTMRRTPHDRYVWSLWVARCAAALHCLAALYLGYWAISGWRLWT